MLSRRVVALVVIVVSIALSAMLFMVYYYTPAGNTLFFVYGDAFCPHCERFVEFLRDNHYNYYFCNLESSKTCSISYINITSELGLPEAVPLTVVVKNNHIIAIIIGEVEDKGFLEQLAKQNPSEEIPVYYSTNLVGHINIPDTIQKQIISNIIKLSEHKNG